MNLTGRDQRSHGMLPFVTLVRDVRSVTRNKLEIGRCKHYFLFFSNTILSDPKSLSNV